MKDLYGFLIIFIPALPVPTHIMIILKWFLDPRNRHVTTKGEFPVPMDCVVARFTKTKLEKEGLPTECAARKPT